MVGDVTRRGHPTSQADGWGGEIVPFGGIPGGHEWHGVFVEIPGMKGGSDNVGMTTGDAKLSVTDAAVVSIDVDSSVVALAWDQGVLEDLSSVGAVSAHSEHILRATLTRKATADACLRDDDFDGDDLSDALPSVDQYGNNATCRHRSRPSSGARPVASTCFIDDDAPAALHGSGDKPCSDDGSRVSGAASYLTTQRRRSMMRSSVIGSSSLSRAAHRSRGVRACVRRVGGAAVARRLLLLAGAPSSARRWLRRRLAERPHQSAVAVLVLLMMLARHVRETTLTRWSRPPTNLTAVRRRGGKRSRGAPLRRTSCEICLAIGLTFMIGVAVATTSVTTLSDLSSATADGAYIDVTGDITFTSQIEITGTVSISSSSSATLSGGRSTRLFRTKSGGALSLSSITLDGGALTDEGGGALYLVASSSSATLKGVIVSNSGISTPQPIMAGRCTCARAAAL
jgi:hypothetical protein